MTMASPDPTDLVRMYEIAALAVAADEKIRGVLSSGQAMMMYYPARGQELIPAAFSVNLTADDYVVTTYRGIHDQIAKGVPLPALFAEYLGRTTGTCKGKGGPMHVTHPESGLMVTTGIVGSGMPIANGFALASVLQGDGRVTVVNFGDGASNIGAFHESLNLASIWKLPVIFVCQNNRYAEHTTYAFGTSVERISDRAAAYSMPGVTVDAGDPTALWTAAHDAVARARAGEGPTLVECLTYKFHGHYFGDAMGYIPKEELKAAIEADPVPRLRRLLVALGHASEEDLAGIDKTATTEVEEAFAFAMASPFPEPDEIRRDVYAEELI